MFSKRVLVGLVMFFFAALLVGCFGTTRGNGNVVSESRQHEGFTAVSLSTAVDVALTQGEGFRVVVEAEENLLPLIETTVENGRLIIKTPPNTIIEPTEPTTVFVTMPVVDALTVTGSGELAAPTLAANHLSLSVSGSGDMALGGVTAVSVDADVTGSGNLLLTGEAESQAVAVSGSGGFEGGGMQSRTAVVDVTGSGTATVWAQQTLDATVTGSGNIFYVGNPEVERTVTGSGDINQVSGR